MCPDHPAPMEPIEFGQLNINDDQIRLDGNEFLHDITEIRDAENFVGPL